VTLKLLLLAAACLPSALLATNRISTADGPWHSTVTWGGSPVPTAADNAMLQSAVTLASGNASIVWLQVGNGTGNTGALTIGGSAEPASLTLTHSAADIGRSNSSNGILTLLPNGSLLSASAVLRLGYTGTGNDAHGLVRVAGGSLLAQGLDIASSQTLSGAADGIGGGGGAGRFLLESGSVTINGILNVGNNSTSVSAAFLGVSGGLLLASELRVGNGSTGVLDLSGGSLDLSGNLALSAFNTSANNIATLDAADGEIRVAGDFLLHGNITGTDSGSLTSGGCAAFASLSGDSQTTVSGALALDSAGAAPVANLTLSGRARLSAASLRLSGNSRLLFQITSPDDTARLDISGPVSASDASAIVIDLSKFAAAAPGNATLQLLRSPLPANATLENSVSLRQAATPLVPAASRVWTTVGSNRVLSASLPHAATAPVPLPQRHRLNPLALRVVTANIRQVSPGDYATGNGWENRKQLCLETLSAQDADLICLQEHRPPQSQYLLPRLPVAYDIFDGDENSRRNPILYASARFEKIRQGGFYLTPTRGNTQFTQTIWIVQDGVPVAQAPDGNTTEYPYPSSGYTTRRATWLLLRDKFTNRLLHVFNIHIDSNTGSTTSTDATYCHNRLGNNLRKQQVQALLDFLNDPASDIDPAIPILLTGDFNSTWLGNPIGLLRSAGWKNTYADAFGYANDSTDPDPGRTYHAFIGPAYLPQPGTKIDFILRKAGLHATAAEVIRDSRDGRYPSDHYFVSAELEYDNPPTPPLRDNDEFLLHALSDNYTVTENGITATIPGDLSHLPKVTLSGGALSLTFTPLRSQYRYEVQRSLDLRTWETLATVPASSSPVTLQSDLPVSTTPKQFLRLKITPIR
jgi:endonuclease/exonuclease/phosphatase family metal-dependent hydrolase